MHDPLIQLSTAILAKCKNFNKPTLAYFLENHQSNGFVSVDYIGEGQFGEIIEPKNHNEDLGYILKRFSRPTQTRLAKWLRETHNIHIMIEPKLFDEKLLYASNVIANNIPEEDLKDDYTTDDFFDTYEAAAEDALSYGLTLIPKL